MAKGLKTGGKRFPTGNNYGGRPKLPDDLKIAKASLSNDILKAKISKFLLYTKEELQKAMRDESLSMIDFTLCSIIAKAATLSDPQRLDFVLTRLLGKEPEKIIQLNLHQHHSHELEEIPIEVLRSLAAKKDTKVDDGESESAVIDVSGHSH